MSELKSAIFLFFQEESVVERNGFERGYKKMFAEGGL